MANIQLSLEIIKLNLILLRVPLQPIVVKCPKRTQYMGILTSQEIGRRLREFRKRRGLTQEQLAVMIDVTFQQIQKYESGFTRLNTDKLQVVAQALSVPVSAFFDDDKTDVRLLSPEEIRLVEGFRTLSSTDKREFVLSSLSKDSV